MSPSSPLTSPLSPSNLSLKTSEKPISQKDGPRPPTKLWLIIGTAIILLILGTAALLIYQNRQPQSRLITPPAPPTPTVPSPTPTTPAPPTSTTNWKTYTDKKHRFRFKYPPNLYPEDTVVPTGKIPGAINDPTTELWASINFYQTETATSKALNCKNLQMAKQPLPEECSTLLLLNPLSVTTKKAGNKYRPIQKERDERQYTDNSGRRWYYIGPVIMGAKLSTQTETTLANHTYLVNIQAGLEKFNRYLGHTKPVDFSNPTRQVTEFEKLTQNILSTFRFLDPVEITTPLPNSTISNPVIVKGTVEPGWMFEGVFPIKLLDNNRREIARTLAHETLPGSWTSGKRVGFTATLKFTTPTPQGFLVFENDNPSGLPENAASFEIPVSFPTP